LGAGARRSLRRLEGVDMRLRRLFKRTESIRGWRAGLILRLIASIGAIGGKEYLRTGVS